MTQKIPSRASSLPKLKPIQEIPPSLSEKDEENEPEEAEIDDEEDYNKSTISNINSLDPAQWNKAKRNLPEFVKQQDDIRRKLLYVQSKTTSKRPSP